MDSTTLRLLARIAGAISDQLHTAADECDTPEANPATVFGNPGQSGQTVSAPLAPAFSTAVAAPPAIAPAALPVTGTPPIAPPPIAPPPAAIVPPAPAIAIASPPAPTGEVDSAGLPWDARIHAASKSKIGDGTWRMKKGVDEATKLAVVAELRGQAAVLPTITPPVGPVATVPGSVFPPPIIATQAASVTPIAAVPIMPGLSPTTQLIIDISKATNLGKVSNAEVTAIANQLGLAALGEVQARPDLVDAFRTLLAGRI